MVAPQVKSLLVNNVDLVAPSLPVASGGRLNAQAAVAAAIAIANNGEAPEPGCQGVGDQTRAWGEDDGAAVDQPCDGVGEYRLSGLSHGVCEQILRIPSTSQTTTNQSTSLHDDARSRQPRVHVSTPHMLPICPSICMPT